MTTDSSNQGSEAVKDAAGAMRWRCFECHVTWMGPRRNPVRTPAGQRARWRKWRKAMHPEKDLTLTDRGQIEFEKWAAPRGWKLGKKQVPGHMPEYADDETANAWIGWRHGWDTLLMIIHTDIERR